MRGYIKLHRKILSNPIYQNDPTAIRIFIHLLLTADRHSGIVEKTRNDLVRELDIKSSTLYDGIKRLENAKMVGINHGTRKSSIYICNWGTYQQDAGRATGIKTPSDRNSAGTPSIYTRKEEEKNNTYPQKYYEQKGSNMLYRDWMATDMSTPFDEWVDDNGKYY